MTQPLKPNPRLTELDLLGLSGHINPTEPLQQTKDKARNQKACKPNFFISKSYLPLLPQMSFLWYCKCFHGDCKVGRTSPFPFTSSSFFPRNQLHFLFSLLPSASCCCNLFYICFFFQKNRIISSSVRNFWFLPTVLQNKFVIQDCSLLCQWISVYSLPSS